MTIKTLFNIIFKILGVFFIKDMLISTIQTFSFIIILQKPGSVFNLTQLLLFFITTVVYCAAAWLLIFKSDVIVQKLHIAKSFDQQLIPLNMHRSTILSIAIIVIGGYMVADEIPNLCRQLYNYYSTKSLYSTRSFDLSYAILAAAKIIVGLALMGLQRPIVNLIELKRKHHYANE